ncbi:hypothetical protein C8Q74DRAFT_1442145 [Fomes fomentarius]|nr:hypothetical protein C8Q74DRAFT_1442145 [Fomes fomentarius]
MTNARQAQTSSSRVPTGSEHHVSDELWYKLKFARQHLSFRGESRLMYGSIQSHKPRRDPAPQSVLRTSMYSRSSAGKCIREEHSTEEPNMDPSLFARQRADEAWDVTCSPASGGLLELEGEDTVHLICPRSFTTDCSGHPHLSEVGPRRCAAVYHCGAGVEYHGVHGSTYPITASPHRARRMAWLVLVSHRRLLVPRACSSWPAARRCISPPGGIRRSRRVPLRLLPLPTRTPFRYSHLSGMGDSDCAERARRIARLSLPLKLTYHTQDAPVLKRLRPCTEHSQLEGSRT